MPYGRKCFSSPTSAAPGPMPICRSPARVDGSGSADFFGLSGGGGAEVALTPNWCARFDYQFTDFNSETVNYPGGSIDYDPDGSIYRCLEEDQSGPRTPWERGPGRPRPSDAKRYYALAKPSFDKASVGGPADGAGAA